MTNPEESAAATTGAAPAAAPAKKEKKAPPPGLVIPPKKPKLTKAERRALQEQQRAAKAAGAGNKNEKKSASTTTEKSNAAAAAASSSHTSGGGQQKQLQQQSNKQSAAATLEASAETTPTPSASRLSMVSHLTPFRSVEDIFDQGATLRTKKHLGTTSPPSTMDVSTSGLHPAVVQLGYRYASGEIRGGNARCRAMLACWQQVFQDFQPPDEAQDLRPVVDALLKTSFQFWTETCRPHSVSMGNACTMLKTATASLDRTTTWTDMQTVLLETMQAYTRERIDFAGRAIADLACTKLLPDSSHSSTGNNNKKTRTALTGRKNNPHSPTTILVYGYSEVVSLVLRQAAAQHKDFAVICVDSRPLLEGRRMLQELRDAGVKDCTYILLNALTYVLPNVTTVLVGASALMSDGAVWNRVGTANVALLASTHNIPVLVCAESYKISNRVQLESLTHNELGAPPANPQEDEGNNVGDDDTAAAAADDDDNEKALPNLTRLNLLYDLTPASFVSGIVTELGIVPPTSVAVLLRELNSQQQV